MSTDADPDAGRPVEPDGGVTTETPAEPGLVSPAQRRRLADFARRLRANPKAMIGLGIVLVVLAAGLLGPVFISRDAATAVNVGERFQAPSLAHPFGTDNLGRDLFVRTVLGAQTSVYIGTLSVAIATVFGVPLGAIAGFEGGNLDDAVMRTMDILMSFPPILMALTISAVLGPSLTNALIAIGVVYIPYFARVTRSEVVSVAEEDFVEASRALGERESRVLFGEVLPNAVSPIIVQISISMAYAILAAAGLSFLGLGVQPPNPSWGLMIQQAKQYIAQAPWMALFPGFAIAMTVMGFNLLGDGIRDVIDPSFTTEIGAEDE